jgi:Flp pilus assembly protein TadG
MNRSRYGTVLNVIDLPEGPPNPKKINKADCIMTYKGSIHRRRGALLVYVTIAMVVALALAMLCIDVAHGRLVKEQLQGAADAAARYGAQGISDGTATAKAQSIAASNTADGTAVVLQSGDVTLGTWSGGTFTTGGSSPNAVEVTAVRSTARGNAVSIWWGGLFGQSATNLTVTSIATGAVTPEAGFIGFGSINMQNNTFFGSYSSSQSHNPSHGSAGSKARVGSNGAINGHNNDTLQGAAIVGPGGSVSGITISGSTVNQGSNITVPTLPTWSPSGTPTALTVNGNTTLPGGTYWYTSMTINANLTFSGPTTIYVDGDVVIGGTLAPSSGSPGDLVIYQFGSNTFGDAAVNGMNITAEVIAPNSDFLAKNNLTYYGSGIFNSITTKNNADFYYDTNIGPADGSSVVAVVQ